MKKHLFLTAVFACSAIVYFSCSGNKEESAPVKTDSVSVTLTPLEEIAKAAGIDKNTVLAPTDTSEMIGSWYPSDSTKFSFLGKDIDIASKGLLQRYGTKLETIGTWSYADHKLTVTIGGKEKTYYVAFDGSTDVMVLVDPQTKAFEKYEIVVGC